MFKEEDGKLPIEGLQVYDAVVMVQIIDKALRTGTIEGPELTYVAVTRDKLVTAIRTTTGTDIDGRSANDGVMKPVNVDSGLKTS